MIHLHTLGDSLITVGEKEIRPSSPMVFAALLYLGVERGRRVPRAALQELFFPNVDERSGSHSVRQLLYKLRQLGVPVVTDPHAALVRDYDVIDNCSHDCVSRCDDSDVMAKGFVPDYLPTLSDRFRVWLDEQRAVVTSRVRRSLAQRLEELRRRGDLVGAERMARSLLRIDPLHETATLALAEATAIAGSKAGALTMLSQYVSETGRAELRLAPAVLQQRIHNLGRSERPDATPLFGREKEMEHILPHLLQASTGSRHVTVITGEAGIGKSRLIEELATVLTVRGSMTQVVRCRPEYANRPLSVFIDLVPQLLNTRGALGVSPDSLKQLRRFATHSQQSETDGEVDNSALSESLHRSVKDLCDAVASEQAPFIVIEDVQWCDEASISLLASLVAHTSVAPTLLFSSRGTDSELLRRTFGESAYFYRLHSLSDDSMRQLAARWLGNRHASANAWAVAVASGNPLFLRMLCAHVVATNKLEVPDDLLTLIQRRVQALPQPPKRILQFITLLGRHCSVDSLRIVSSNDPAQLLDHLALLEVEGYLRLVQHRIRLTHDLVADVVLSEIPTITKKATHATVATFLEGRLRATDNTEFLWDCAEQWQLSGDSEKALALILECSRHASSLGRATEALYLLERARPIANDCSQTHLLVGEMILLARLAGVFTDVKRLAREYRMFAPPSHNDQELHCIEADWIIDDIQSPAHLLACARCENATPKHRLHACLLLLRLAHELCDHALGTKAFQAVAPILAGAAEKDRLIVEVVYHTCFGHTATGAERVNDLTTLLPYLPIEERIQLVRNAAVAMLVLNDPETAADLAEQYYGLAQSLGLKARSFEFGTLAASIFAAIEDYGAAQSWLERLEVIPNGRSNDMYYALQIEVALSRGDAPGARHFLSLLNASGFGKWVRDQAYMLHAAVRIAQLDKDHNCDADTLAQLARLYVITRSFFGADSLVEALVEGLLRSGQGAAAKSILREYVDRYRRETWPLPPSLRRFETSSLELQLV